MKINKKAILPLTFGVALVGTLVYFLSKALKASAQAPQLIDDGGGTTPTPEPEPERNFIVSTRSGTRLRSESSTSSTILKTYESGYKMVVIGQATESDGLWYNVQDPFTKQTGFMRSDVVDVLGYQS